MFPGASHAYTTTLISYDTEPSILTTRIPESPSLDEPQAKRQRSAGVTATSTIAERVLQDEYAALHDLVSDVAAVVKDQLAVLEASGADGNVDGKNQAISKVIGFREKAFELYRRESIYPQTSSEPANDAKNATQYGTEENAVLTVFGNAPQPRYLFTSLQRRATTPDNAEAGIRPLQEIAIPNGLSTTRIIPLGAPDKGSRTLTLGELFPSPRNLPPLQPPKAPKSTTKSTVLGFYHPELSEKSKYRSGSYFSQTISVGHWLDYSNATPSSQIKTKQRERAQSLAGHKPSSTELEMSEMEALFRGAFSSFAPSKDDSAAMVSSGQLGRMWWQRAGQRTFQRMIEAEVSEEDAEEPNVAAPAPMEIDEQAVQKAIDEWDDSMVDPTLEEALGNKSKEDKEMDDVLQDVSDLIETLASYQRNRNLTLPTSQDRYSTDPVNGDMLRNGSLAQQPSEEEMATYQALKAQLSLIIKTLPPYAVARLNADKLDELNVSTKIEIRTVEYKGVMEEDEPAARARQQQVVSLQAASGGPRSQPHRPPSISGTPYPYSAQYGTPNRTPMPNAPPYYQQTPPRAQPAPIHQRPSLSGTPSVPHAPVPAPATQPYRPANGYPGYGSQLPKAPTPYSHASMHYARTPSQPRGTQSYGHTPQPGTTPQYRYSQGFPAGYPQQQQGIASQHHVQQGVYPAHANGTGHVALRAMSPQVAGQHPAYGQTPQGQQPRPSYATPPTLAPPSAAVQRHYSSGSQGVPAAGQSVTPGGFATVMDQPQLQRVLDQAKARMTAHERTQSFGDKIAQSSMGQIAGLAGIGLGGNVDINKLAAARANMPGGVAHMSPSPKPQAVIPRTASPSLNGMLAAGSASPASQRAPSSVSPGPGVGLPKPPL